MAGVQRNEFVHRLADRGGYVVVDQLPSEVQSALSQVGIQPQDLQRIAGSDGVIRGNTEFEALFREIDRRDGRLDQQLTTRGPSGELTAAGRIYEGLGQVVDANRARAAAEGGRRFAGEPSLDAVQNGQRVLELGSSGEGVRRVQQALSDIGFDTPGGVNGTYDADTARAVERFQREVGLTVDGRVGPETLGALAATVPPPGERLERSAEYDRMYADGRLDVTIAIGFDEHGTTPDRERAVLSGLRQDGYRPINRNSLPPAERDRLGLNDERWDPNARYFHRSFTDDRTGRQVDAVVRLVVAPSDGVDGREARESFRRALEQDEVVIYGGHARYGTGPDFDHLERGAGNFVIDGQGNRHGSPPPAGLRQVIDRDRTDLRSVRGRPEYQLLVFNGCSTEEYLPMMRDQRVFGRNAGNTDVIATTIPTSGATSGAHLVRFLNGVTRRESNNSLLAAQNVIERSHRERFDDQLGAERARTTYTESGFLGNDGNRRVRTP